MPSNIYTPTPQKIEQEAERLFKALLHVHCTEEKTWTFEKCLEIAPLTLEINILKQEHEAVLLAHSYTFPEIVYGVADFKSDSYALCLEAKRIKAKKIIFSGVVFMAETAKIICPEADVLIPDIESGCSLADSLSEQELKDLQAQHPQAATVCYINSSSFIKALSDVVVTSSNVYQIIQKLPQNEILFVPDRLMAENIKIDLHEKNISKTIYSSSGTCEVHDQFDGRLIDRERKKYPGLKVIGHPECPTEVTRRCDFVGSTGKMMEYVKKHPSNYIMMLTECGLVSRLEAENPEAHFISSCKLCPYMKKNSLEKILATLKNPKPEQFISVEERVQRRALKSINRMFELTS